MPVNPTTADPLLPRPRSTGLFHLLLQGEILVTPWERYGAALIICAAGTVFRLTLLQTIGGRAPFVTLYPAVILTALVAGFWPGIFAAALSLVAASSIWLAGQVAFGPPELAAASLFLFCSLVVCATVETSRRARRRMEQQSLALSQANARLQKEIELRTSSDFRLRTSEERFRLAAFSEAITLYEQDAALRYVWLYPEHAEHRGAIGKTDVEIIAGSVGTWLQEIKQEVMATGSPRRVEVRAPLIGGVRYYDTFIAPRRGADGGITGVAGTALDITERRLAEEHRQRLAAIVEFSEDAILAKDLNNIITSWNQGASRIFGYSAEEAIGQSIAMLIPPDLLAQEAQMMVRVRQGERIDHYETERMRKDGERIYISLTISPLRSATGEIVGVSKIARNTTERVRRERLVRFLADLNERVMPMEQPDDILAAAAEATGRHLGAHRCGFLEWHVGNGVASVAHAWQPGGTPAAGGTFSVTAFAPAAWWARLAASNVAVDDVETEPELVPLLPVYRQLELRAAASAGFGRKSGLAVVLGVTMKTPRIWRTDELELIESVVSRVWPLVERSRTEQALRRSERQLRLVADHAPVFLVHLDREHRYRFVNQTYARRYGFEPHELTGRELREVIGESAFATIRPWIERALRGERVEFETELDYKALGRRWVHVIYTPEEGAGGQFVGVIGLVLDVTARREAERAVEQARDEAVAAARAKDDFLAALSHELRTPLNPVLLVASDAAERVDLPADIRQDFATIRKSVELEARLIDDLLDLTRITRGKLPLDLRLVDGATVLRDALAVAQPDAAEKGIALTVKIGDGEFPLMADAVRLQQVFWNVLKNAVKFTPPGGQIQVCADNGEDHQLLRVEVSDTGIGMVPSEIERVFDAFVQGEHATAGGGAHRFGGVGLGLTISRMLVELHGGRIRAQSAGRDQGSTFVIEIPCAPRASSAGSGAAGQGGLAVAREPAGNAMRRMPRKILLVEDHVATRDALASLLRRRNYEVVTTGSVAEARQKAREPGLALVLSDIGLPDGDGCELMAELRTLGLKGIALTGYGMDADIMRTAEAGFLAHLTKPIRIQALDAALDAAFRE